MGRAAWQRCRSALRALHQRFDDQQLEEEFQQRSIDNLLRQANLAYGLAALASFRLLYWLPVGPTGLVDTVAFIGSCTSSAMACFFFGLLQLRRCGWLQRRPWDWELLCSIYTSAILTVHVGTSDQALLSPGVKVYSPGQELRPVLPYFFALLWAVSTTRFGWLWLTMAVPGTIAMGSLVCRALPHLQQTDGVQVAFGLVCFPYLAVMIIHQAWWNEANVRAAFRAGKIAKAQQVELAVKEVEAEVDACWADGLQRLASTCYDVILGLTADFRIAKASAIADEFLGCKAQGAKLLQLFEEADQICLQQALLAMLHGADFQESRSLRCRLQSGEQRDLLIHAAVLRRVVVLSESEARISKRDPLDIRFIVGLQAEHLRLDPVVVGMPAPAPVWRALQRARSRSPAQRGTQRTTSKESVELLGRRSGKQSLPPSPQQLPNSHGSQCPRQHPSQQQSTAPRLAWGEEERREPVISDNRLGQFDGIWVPCDPLAAYRDSLRQFSIQGSFCLDGTKRAMFLRAGIGTQVLLAGTPIEVRADGFLYFWANPKAAIKYCQCSGEDAAAAARELALVMAAAGGSIALPQPESAPMMTWSTEGAGLTGHHYATSSRSGSYRAGSQRSDAESQDSCGSAEAHVLGSFSAAGRHLGWSSGEMELNFSGGVDGCGGGSARRHPGPAKLSPRALSPETGPVGATPLMAQLARPATAIHQLEAMTAILPGTVGRPESVLV